MLTKTVLRGTTSFVYDAKNRVTSISGPDGTETSVWGPDGQRVQMAGTALANETGGAARPIYDLSGNPFVDADTGGGILRYRIYGPGVDEPLVEINLANGAKPKAFLHHDALGSITSATDPNGNVVYRYAYRAFGARTFTTTPNTNIIANAFSRLSYTSRENSVGSLYQYRSRYYDSGYGRMLQQDSYEGSEVSPPSLHRYAYAINNPVLYVDPQGFAPSPTNSYAALAIASVLAALITMFVMAGVVYLLGCLINSRTFPEIGGCIVTVLSLFIGDPVLQGVEAAEEAGGGVLNVFAMVLDGTLDYWTFALLAYAVVSPALLIYALGAALELGPWTTGAIVIGSVVPIAAWTQYVTERFLDLHRRGLA